MVNLIDLVAAYLRAQMLAERMRIAEEIIRRIGPPLQAYLFSRLRHEQAEDAYQDTLVVIATKLHRFRGGSEREFWGWCYRIAHNKKVDLLRREGGGLQASANEETEDLDQEALRPVIEASARVEPLSPGDRLDLEYALNLLNKAAWPCNELLWLHFVLDCDYGMIARVFGLKTYNAARMKIRRCLETAQKLMQKGK